MKKYFIVLILFSISFCTSTSKNEVNEADDTESLLTIDALLDSIVDIHSKTYEEYFVSRTFFDNISQLIDKYKTQEGIYWDELSARDELILFTSLIDTIFPDIMKAMSQYDLNRTSHLETIKKRYFYHYYFYKLQAFNEEVLEDVLLWNNWYDNETNFNANVVYDGQGGSASPHERNTFDQSITDSGIDEILEIYFLLQGEHYKVDESIYQEIPRSEFEKEYALYLDAINNSFEGSLASYTISEKVEMLNTTKNAWYEFMEKRREISNSLNDSLKAVFDRATYRYQKKHLLDFKNNYTQHTYLNSSSFEMVLKNTCSYSTLYNSERPFGTPGIYSRMSD